MDELFQRAAENYPLNKGKGDWENVAQRIADKPGEPVMPAVSKNNTIKKITALCLLLCIGTISWFIFQNNKQKISTVHSENALSHNPEKAGTNISATNSQNASRAVVQSPMADIQKNKSNYNNNSSNRANNYTLSSDIRTAGRPDNIANKNFIVTNENSDDKPILKPDNYFAPEKKMSKKNDEINSLENRNITNDISLKNKKNDDELSVEKNTSEETAGIDKKKKGSLHITERKKGFYVGVAAGPDFSKVHSGSFGHSGFNAGLIAGYRLSKRISFESGISWNKKYYTSEGKNFHMDKVASSMPQGMIINNLESNNSFVEVPLKARFDFITGRDAAWFVAAGVSAYIITKERNMYQVTLNGDNKKMLGVYEKNNYGLPAVANFSLGYEKNILKNVDIRIEPYLKIPLRGMGVGSLPVTSAGLQLGFISRLK